jgi:threonylcarbamoyladenosine tRNA methylthiotransferase MtaB
LVDIRGALDVQVKEIVLTGVHVGAWGLDLKPRAQLSHLIEDVLSSINEDVRIRVSSLEPWDLDSNFFRFWDDLRLCPHFHLPLQSGADSILKRMARKTNTMEYTRLLEIIRSRMPDAAVTTDVIVGFPGETDQDFQTTMDFIQSCQFAGGHVFSYSARAGTPAANFPGQVNGKIKRLRSALIHDLLTHSGMVYRQKFIGSSVQVLWESAKKVDGGYRLGGWTPQYIRVEAFSAVDRWNQIQQVELTEVTDTGCRGMIIAPEMPAAR